MRKPINVSCQATFIGRDVCNGLLAATACGQLVQPSNTGVGQQAGHPSILEVPPQGIQLLCLGVPAFSAVAIGL